jgi:zinc transport system substrate-binding protein
MKKFIAILIVFILSTAMLSGCGQFGSNEKMSVVCTIFPQYDWVCQILGDRAGDMEITLLLKNKIDLHNYQPSVDDIVKISECDLFIYVGGESDKWVDETLKQASGKNMSVIKLLDVLGEAAKEEETKPGMENENNENEEEGGYDEHVWLSLKNARIFCAKIAEVFCLLDLGNSGLYKNNLDAYDKKLSDLDDKYQKTAEAAPIKTLLFGDRFPFRYLTDDYSLDYYAAFAGCSAETEASFETVIFLAEKTDELKLKNIMVTESSDLSIAETIKNNTKNKNQQILVLNAIQSVTSDDISKGVSYLSIMENNLEILKKALN